MSQALLIDVPAMNGVEDGAERYTTAETMRWVKTVTGVDLDGWDVDAAACAESYWADCWFDKASDGLQQEWWGKVWCNPPYSNLMPWVRKAGESIRTEDGDGRAGLIAMLVPANRCEQPWWQEWIEPRRDGRWPWARGSGYLTTHFMPTRARFGHPGNVEGHGVGSPPFGCVLLVWRRA